MLSWGRWKTWSVIAACLVGVLLTLPNLFSAASLERLPAWLPKHQMSLGLDLQGGSHLLLEVDLATVARERLNGDLDAVRTELLKQRIGYSNLSVASDRLNIVLRDPNDAGKLPAILRAIDADLASTSDGGTVSAAFRPESARERNLKTVEQSIDVVRRRIDELGTREPNIVRQGEDRILVQVPGLSDPERLKTLLGKTAKLAFRFLDESGDVAAAKAGGLPPGDDLLPDDDPNPRPGHQSAYLVRKRVIVDGGDLVNAQEEIDPQTNEWRIAFRFNGVGGRHFGEATRENVGKRFAIVLDNKVLSAPVIQGPIEGGSGIITGDFTAESARLLAIQLRAGALPAPLTIVEERTVGPDLGADSIRAGSYAALIAIVLVVTFMVLFYGLFGIFADIALFFNLCLLLGLLSVLGATLTLPGIAGIALTMGMAVDANVLVNERIREEMRLGRGMISAIDAGFGRAYATIMDANVTHFIAGSFLFFLGSGPVKGFAVTLVLGILTSLFTTIFVSRLLVVWWLRRRPKTLPI